MADPFWEQSNLERIVGVGWARDVVGLLHVQSDDQPGGGVDGITTAVMSAFGMLPTNLLLPAIPMLDGHDVLDATSRPSAVPGVPILLPLVTTAMKQNYNAWRYATFPIASTGGGFNAGAQGLAVLNLNRIRSQIGLQDFSFSVDLSFPGMDSDLIMGFRTSVVWQTWRGATSVILPRPQDDPVAGQPGELLSSAGWSGPGEFATVSEVAATFPVTLTINAANEVAVV